MPGAPSWWGQGPLPGLKVKEQQYRGADGGYRPYMYDTSGLQRATGWDGYVGPGGVKLDSKGRVQGQWYQGGAERTMNGGSSGGGGSGGVIPNAGTYLEAQAMAQAAYDAAVASAKAKKSSQFRQAGIDETTGNVNPLQQYGEYQAMLQNQGGALDMNQNAAYERGIGGRGLGNQAERITRYANAVEGLGFQGKLQGYQSDYANAMSQAEQDRRQRMYDALQSARESSYGDWGNPDSGPGTEDPSTSLLAPVGGNMTKKIDKFINRKPAPKRVVPWGGQTVIQNRQGPKPPAKKPVVRPWGGQSVIKNRGR